MVDTSKKSNIKCEHCNCWNRGKCNNECSPKWNTKVNYWNRCKEFDWNERIKQEIKMRAFAISELEKIKAEMILIRGSVAETQEDLIRIIARNDDIEIINKHIAELKGE